MKHIIDFDTGCGTLSSVFDGVLDYTVSYNYGLNENNLTPYNLIHLNNFDIEDAPNIDVDLFIGTPHLGNEISKRGRANIDFSELNNCLNLISLKNPEVIILAVLKNGFIFLNDYSLNKQVCYTVDNYPTVDYIVYILSCLGYFVDRFIIDEANFGIPQHKEFVFYVGKKDEFSSLLKKINQYRVDELAKPIDFLRQFDVMDSVHVWNHDKNTRYESVCSLIQEGSNAKKTKEVSQCSGYYRLRSDVPCKPLRHDFYRVSSRGPSIHPTKNRPLTLLEGAYLSGIYGNIWEKNADKKIVADMISRAVAPSVARIVKKVVLENVV